MGDAVEHLFALGWPGFDEAWRTDAAHQVDLLAKDLRGEGRDAEADALKKRVHDSSARDVFVRLNWIGDAGLELAVSEPLGATAGFRTPRTVFGGAIVKSVYGSRNAECVYSCPLGFDGEYLIKIDVIYNDPKKPVTTARLEIITHEGTPQEKKETKEVPLNKLAPVVVTLKGGRRKEVLPYHATPEQAEGPVAGAPEAEGGRPQGAKAEATTRPAPKATGPR